MIVTTYDHMLIYVVQSFLCPPQILLLVARPESAGRGGGLAGRAQLLPSTVHGLGLPRDFARERVDQAKARRWKGKWDLIKTRATVVAILITCRLLRSSRS